MAEAPQGLPGGEAYDDWYRQVVLPDLQQQQQAGPPQPEQAQGQGPAAAHDQHQHQRQPDYEMLTAEQHAHHVQQSGWTSQGQQGPAHAEMHMQGGPGPQGSPQRAHTADSRVKRLSDQLGAATINITSPVIQAPQKKLDTKKTPVIVCTMPKIS